MCERGLPCGLYLIDKKLTDNSKGKTKMSNLKILTRIKKRDSLKTKK